MRTPLTQEQLAWVESKLNKRMSAIGGATGMVVDYKPDSVGMGVFFIILPNRQRNKVDNVEYIEEYKEFPPKLLKPSQRGVRPRGSQRTNGAPLRLVTSDGVHSRSSSSRWHGASA